MSKETSKLTEIFTVDNFFKNLGRLGLVSDEIKNAWSRLKEDAIAREKNPK